MRNKKQKPAKITFVQSKKLAMSRRVALFKEEYNEFSTLDESIVSHLIKLYDQNFDKKFQCSSMPMIVGGAYLLWVCWLFFNGVAGKSITEISSSNIP